MGGRKGNLEVGVHESDHCGRVQGKFETGSGQTWHQLSSSNSSCRKRYCTEPESTSKPSCRCTPDASRISSSSKQPPNQRQHPHTFAACRLVCNGDRPRSRPNRQHPVSISRHEPSRPRCLPKRGRPTQTPLRHHHPDPTRHPQPPQFKPCPFRMDTFGGTYSPYSHLLPDSN